MSTVQFNRLPLIAFGVAAVVGFITGFFWEVPGWSLPFRLMFFTFMGGFCGLILTFRRML